MGRMISAERIKIAVAECLATLSGEYNAEDIKTVMADVTGMLVRMATVDVDAVALEVVKRDFEDSGHTLSGMHKIRNIKEVRTQTGADLREAKIAVERAIPVAVRDHANAVLTMLRIANCALPEGDYGSRQYVNAAAHPAVLSDLWSAANNHSPF